MLHWSQIPLTHWALPSIGAFYLFLWNAFATDLHVAGSSHPSCISQRSSQSPPLTTEPEVLSSRLFLTPCLPLLYFILFMALLSLWPPPCMLDEWCQIFLQSTTSLCILEATLGADGFNCPLVLFRFYFALNILFWVDETWLLWLAGNLVYLWGSPRNNGLKTARIRTKHWLTLSPASICFPLLCQCSLFFSLLGPFSLYFYQAGEREEKSNVFKSVS